MAWRLLFVATMAFQAGSDLGAEAPEVLVIGHTKWSFGPIGPILKALGVGFAIGVITTALVVAIAG